MVFSESYKQGVECVCPCDGELPTSQGVVFHAVCVCVLKFVLKFAKYWGCSYIKWFLSV